MANAGVEKYTVRDMIPTMSEDLGFTDQDILRVLAASGLYTDKGFEIRVVGSRASVTFVRVPNRWKEGKTRILWLKSRHIKEVESKLGEHEKEKVRPKLSEEAVETLLSEEGVPKWMEKLGAALVVYWFGGHGRSPGCRGRRRCRGVSWPGTTRPLWGWRSQPPLTTACGEHASRWGERTQILRKAAGVVERHMVAGTLLCGAPLGQCRSLLPLGGRLSACPFFAARHEVMLQLMRLATHCRDMWVRRPRTPARIRPPLGDHFLMDYYPRPL